MLPTQGVLLPSPFPSGIGTPFSAPPPSPLLAAAAPMLIVSE